MEYRIIYSKRKTVGIVIKDCEVIVRAPFGTGRTEIERIVKKHGDWINKKLEECIRRQNSRPRLSEEEVVALIASAKEYFGYLVPRVAERMGVKYSRLSITRAMHRFGSCSSKGSISLSYRLMLYPAEARLYVVVHELAHLVHLNHSGDFYSLVAKYLPEYKKYEALLK